MKVGAKDYKELETRRFSTLCVGNSIAWQSKILDGLPGVNGGRPLSSTVHLSPSDDGRLQSN